MRRLERRRRDALAGALTVERESGGDAVDCEEKRRVERDKGGERRDVPEGENRWQQEVMEALEMLQISQELIE